MLWPKQNNGTIGMLKAMILKLNRWGVDQHSCYYETDVR